MRRVSEFQLETPPAALKSEFHASWDSRAPQNASVQAVANKKLRRSVAHRHGGSSILRTSTSYLHRHVTTLSISQRPASTSADLKQTKLQAHRLCADLLMLRRNGPAICLRSL